jgi:hypothetical protein
MPITGELSSDSIWTKDYREVALSKIKSIEEQLAAL